MIPFNPFSALTSKIFGGVAIAALTFGAVQTMRIEGFLFIHGFKQDVADRDKQITDLIAASVKAKADQDKINADHVASNKEVNHENETLRQQVMADGRSARDRFADTHGLRQNCDRLSAAGTAAMPVAPPVDHDEAATPDMVAVPRKDYDKLTDASLQAAIQYEWGQSLIDKGLAIPDPAFGTLK